MERTADEGSLRPRKLLTPEPRDIDETLAGMDGNSELDESVGCVVVTADSLQRRRTGIDSQPPGTGRVERNGLHALLDLRNPQPVNSIDHGGDRTGNRFDTSVDVGELGIEIHRRVADRTPIAGSCTYGFDAQPFAAFLAAEHLGERGIALDAGLASHSDLRCLAVLQKIVYRVDGLPITRCGCRRENLGSGATTARDEAGFVESAQCLAHRVTADPIFG